jgi:Ca-activated chloride channel homolog
MHFAHPTLLLLLWLLPGVAALLVYAHRRRVAAARQFVAQPMVARLMPALGGSRPWVKGTLLVLGLAMLLVAAARPQFGEYYEKVASRGVDCFVLLDVSRSMLAEDVAPSRLGRAKLDIRDLLKKLAGDRVGLIVFAGKAVLKAPLTTDEAFFTSVLDEVDTRSAPVGGTLIGDAIRKALDAMPPRGDHDQVIVLLTDGEDQDSYPLEAARKAAERGVKIFTVGLGDSGEGARIPIRDAKGKLAYLQDEGKEHWSKADQNTLAKIATATGGANLPAGTTNYDLGDFYESHLAGLARGEETQERQHKQLHERYQMFLAAALALLGLEMLIPAYPGARRRRGLGVAVPLVALGCLFGSPAESLAAPRDAPRKVEQGLQAFAARDFKTAGELFAKAAEDLPDEPRIAFDRGCAYAAAGETDKAAEQFLAAAVGPHQKLAAEAHYNLGCLGVAKAKKQLGEKPEDAKPEVRKEGLESLTEAVGRLRDCLAIEPEHPDARYNLEALRLWIKQIQEVWRQRDREKQRQLGLLEFLQWLEQQQRQLRADSRAIVGEPDSPRHREALRQITTAQHALAGEVEPLRDKLHAALAAPAPTAGTAPAAAPPAANPDVQKALDGMADDLRTNMSAAAEALAARKLAEGVKLQAEAVEKIDNVFMALAPFVNVVQKGIAAQEGLIEQSKQGTMGPKEDGQRTTKSTKVTKKAEERETDWDEAAWGQRFISRYGLALAAKARHELEQMDKAPAASPSPPTAPAGGNAPNAQQQEAMKMALQAGVTNGPKVEKLSSAAAVALAAAKPARALPSQEEALRLLKEMLPKQDQKDQDKKDQEKKDQEKRDKDKKDQDKKDQQKKDQEKKDREKKDQKKDQEKNQKQNQKQDQRKPEESKGQKQDPTKQQAEEALRRVRQRQQERRELEKMLIERLYAPNRVERDW